MQTISLDQQCKRSIVCPYCWQTMMVNVELLESTQKYVQDCEVCCQPIDFTVDCTDGQLLTLQVDRTQ